MGGPCESIRMNDQCLRTVEVLETLEPTALEEKFSIPIFSEISPQISWASAGCLCLGLCQDLCQFPWPGYFSYF